MPIINGTGGTHIRAQCRYCGRDNDDQGEWFWADPNSSCCSTCWEADRSRVVVIRGRYSRPPGSSTDIDGKKLNSPRGSK